MKKNVWGATTLLPFTPSCPGALETRLQWVFYCVLYSLVLLAIFDWLSHSRHVVILNKLVILSSGSCVESKLLLIEWSRSLFCAYFLLLLISFTVNCQIFLHLSLPELVFFYGVVMCRVWRDDGNQLIVQEKTATTAETELFKMSQRVLCVCFAHISCQTNTLHVFVVHSSIKKMLIIIQKVSFQSCVKQISWSCLSLLFLWFCDVEWGFFLSNCTGYLFTVESPPT